MTSAILSPEYTKFLEHLKERIATSRYKASISVNKELILLYHYIGTEILKRQKSFGWGTKVIENISKDLRAEFPEMKGLSARNLVYMQTFAKAYPDFSITQEVLAQITWYHNITLLDKVKNYEERLWYVYETAKNGWSRNVLVAQIQTGLYKRQGKSVNNFQNTLPSLQSDLAQSIIKDPYNLQFLDIQGKVAERELETKLIDHIRKFLLELGQGFAFIGNQYHIELEGEDYYAVSSY